MISHSLKVILFSGILMCMLMLLFQTCSGRMPESRQTENFDRNWKFFLGDIKNGQDTNLDDGSWRDLNLPHDWSIEGSFSQSHPASPGGGALPGGIGWYRKTFFLPAADRSYLTFIAFDGIYRNSEVWINGHFLGKRPFGYISFQYELTPYLNYGDQANTIAVRVDNSRQPNSRWYSGSGIYRHVRLIRTNKLHVDQWGTFISTPGIEPESAAVRVVTRVRNDAERRKIIELTTVVYDQKNREVARALSEDTIAQQSVREITHEIRVDSPVLWSVDNPVLYQAVTSITTDSEIVDRYDTPFGIRQYFFDPQKGFFLNGEHVKIKGVCNHHDLGALGAAVNRRALQRQLELLKEMGCNGIRTSHNPPAPELLDLCDQMGFLVMDEAFDMWRKGKTEYDYHLYFDEWHERDLRDFVRRDRNHPCVILWSIGNELLEQFDKEDSSGAVIAKKLTAIVKDLDATRPVTAACNDISPENPVIRSGALDIIGYNYSHDKYAEFPHIFPGQKLIATETESALATRGSYDMPSDSIRHWPPRWDLPLTTGNPDYSCSSYDNCCAPWGSTHEQTWAVVKDAGFVSGIFTWTGFDYLGEPTPYGWPARSSYFGIIDLAGFPKDAYYFFQSQWTKKDVLHLFPHWNWPEGKTIDIWAYSNCDEVELLLNGNSQGKRKMTSGIMHAMWRLVFKPGILKAIGRRNGREILSREIKTAGKPVKIAMETDRQAINADGRDLAFITIKIVDKDGTMVPDAENLVTFKIRGEGRIAAVDNGSQTSHESFQADSRKAFKGMCLVIVQAGENPSKIRLEAEAEGLESTAVMISTK